MKRLITFSILLFYFFKTPVFSAEYNTLADSSGRTVYLELGDDINPFLTEYKTHPTDSYSKLQTVVISNVLMSRRFKNNYPILLRFLKENSSNLKNLYFNNSEYKDGFEFEELIKILKSVNSAPLENFKWEYQEDIDGRDNIFFFLNDSGMVVKRIKSLSFKGTYFDGKIFYLILPQFTSLRTLNLDENTQLGELFKTNLIVKRLIIYMLNPGAQF